MRPLGKQAFGLDASRLVVAFSDDILGESSVKIRIWPVALLFIGLVAAATPAIADWKRAETSGFIVYSDGDVGVLRENALQLELFESSLRLLHGTDPSARSAQKMTIYLVGDHEGLDEVWPGVPDTVAGFYRPSDDGIFAMAIRERRNLDTLLHEYAHHFMMGSFGAGYPAWFVEGYAEYFMTADLSPRRVTIGNFSQGRADWLGNARWLPYRDIVQNRPFQYRDPNAVAMYYAQSWLLTHWFMSDPTRMRQLLTYVGKLKEGMDSPAALEAATGLSMSDLERTLRAYSRGRIVMRGFSSEQFPPTEVDIRELTPGEDALLLLSLRLSSVDEDDETVVLEEVRRKTETWNTDPFAQSLLARAELRIGERAAGEAIAQRLLEHNENNAEALRLMAEARIRAAEDDGADYAALMGQARGYLARAYAVNDSDFRTLYMLSMTRRGAAGFPNDNDMETLLAAVDLAPQIPTLRFAAAQARVARGETSEAIALLEPVASNPHGDRGAAQARAMISRIGGPVEEAADETEASEEHAAQ